MKAMVINGIGGPEVFGAAERPVPAPGANQIVVQVKAAGVNPIDYKLRKTGALGIKAGDVLGYDAAGVVHAVGAGVTTFAPGDAVYYSPAFGLPGSYAEYNLVGADIVWKKPEGLSFVEAAAIPLAGMTAYDGVVTRGQVRLGETVLISAVNGGVGSLAVQICKAAGAFVIGTCSTRTRAFAETLGADVLIDYQKQDWAAEVKRIVPDGLDLVYDCVGQDYVSKSIPLMKPCGRIVTIVNPSGSLDEGYRRNVAIHYEFLQRNAETLKMLATLLERKQLRPLVDSTLPLEQVAEAHRKLEAGGVKGKVILEVGG